MKRTILIPLLIIMFIFSLVLIIGLWPFYGHYVYDLISLLLSNESLDVVDKTEILRVYVAGFMTLMILIYILLSLWMFDRFNGL